MNKISFLFIKIFFFRIAWKRHKRSRERKKKREKERYWSYRKTARCKYVFGINLSKMLDEKYNLAVFSSNHDVWLFLLPAIRFSKLMRNIHQWFIIHSFWFFLLFAMKLSKKKHLYFPIYSKRKSKKEHRKFLAKLLSQSSSF